MPPDPPRRVRIKKAVALRYQAREEGPSRATGPGQGRLAEKIMALAQEQGMPVAQDPDMLEALARLDLEQDLPPEVYLLAAEVLAFVRQANQAWAGGAPAAGHTRAD